jgi:hypothetical protein
MTLCLCVCVCTLVHLHGLSYLTCLTFFNRILILLSWYLAPDTSYFFFFICWGLLWNTPYFHSVNMNYLLSAHFTFYHPTKNFPFPTLIKIICFSTVFLIWQHTPECLCCMSCPKYSIHCNTNHRQNILKVSALSFTTPLWHQLY